jgi:hypothetical protein
MPKEFRLRLLCLGLLLLAGSAAAQDYDSVLQRLFEKGKVNGPFNYLEFRDGRLHQYAVAKKSGFPEVMHLTFVEEFWKGTGDNDIIDQWVVQVAPDWAAFHYEIVEHESQVLAVRELSTEGAERVVQRVADKTTSMD